ncbi:MAG TPA: TonB-dependent receptor [Ignavibacteriaceae bacterium]|nr:TonB-dependent receptor [Ignavibacteriaceae bacterium]
MIKKIIAILLFGCIYLFAQDGQKQNPGVQLPDFVITGKDIISVENAKKIPPPFVSTLSEQFFKPIFSPENLQVKEIDIPIQGSLMKIDSLNYYKGRIDAGMGLYSLPTVAFNYSQPFENGMLEGFASALNQRPYVANSEKYSFNGGANLFLYVRDDSKIFPGTHFKFGGNYSTTTYKLFASDNPFFKRNLNIGNASVKIENLTSKYVIFSGKIEDKLESLQNENYSENLMNVEGFAKIGFPTFYLGVDANFKKQFLTNNIYNNQIGYFLSARPSVELNITNLLRASFGFYFSQVSRNNFFSPYASAALNLGNGISLFGDYSPQTEFLTPEYFLNQNPYYNPQNFSNLFVKNNSSFDAYIKYEYYTMFEIDGGIKFLSTENLPYFTDLKSPGIFNILTANVKSYSSFVDLLFHLGPYGEFYGTVEVNSTKDSSGNYVPYFPQLKSSLNYGYYFHSGLDAEINLLYNTGSYTGLNNSVELNPDFNLGLKFSYKLEPDFLLTLKLSNLFNHKNYMWNGYQDLPLNVVGGIRYQF